MASPKEIRNKIKSVQSTRKITKAMEMVAASKMRRVQDRMRASRPYVSRMVAIARHLARANPEYRNTFLLKRPQVRNVGLIVVTTDKGLCGGLNTNALRVAFARIKEWQEQGVGIAVTAIGNKGLGFMLRHKLNVVSQVTNIGDRPRLDALIGPVKVQLDLFYDGKIDELHVIASRFENTMKQTPVALHILPIADLGDDVTDKREYPWDYIYEPDAKTVLDELLKRYIEAIIYQAVTENIASEQSARMVAMKAASDNAATIIDELQLIYNKQRQAGITKEISEIVGGAEALK